jgi:hypothetical protein
MCVYALLRARTCVCVCVCVSEFKVADFHETSYNIMPVVTTSTW